MVVSSRTRRSSPSRPRPSDVFCSALSSWATLACGIAFPCFARSCREQEGKAWQEGCFSRVFHAARIVRRRRLCLYLTTNAAGIPTLWHCSDSVRTEYISLTDRFMLALRATVCLAWSNSSRQGQSPSRNTAFNQTKPKDIGGRRGKPASDVVRLFYSTLSSCFVFFLPQTFAMVISRPRIAGPRFPAAPNSLPSATDHPSFDQSSVSG